jgi:hypothetical protein
LEDAVAPVEWGGGGTSTSNSGSSSAIGGGGEEDAAAHVDIDVHDRVSVGAGVEALDGLPDEGAQHVVGRDE